MYNHLITSKLFRTFLISFQIQTRILYSIGVCGANTSCCVELLKNRVVLHKYVVEKLILE